MSKTYKKFKTDIVPNPKKKIMPNYLPDRDVKVTNLASYKSQFRGFLPSFELTDWLENDRDLSF